MATPAGRHRALACPPLARQQAQSAFGPALESIATALRLAPGVDALWGAISELIRFFNFRHPVDGWLRELLGRALEHPAVEPGNLVRPIHQHRAVASRRRGACRIRCCYACSSTR